MGVSPMLSSHRFCMGETPMPQDSDHDDAKGFLENGKCGNAGGVVGASAEASVAVGGGANLLVGGSEKMFTLQPLSVQAQTGLNLAVGVTDFRLRTAAG